MMLEKHILVDKIEILELGQIRVRTATKVFEDGKIISKTFHRHVITPDHVDLSAQDERVQRVANAVWTLEVKQTWVDLLAAQQTVVGE